MKEYTDKQLAEYLLEMRLHNGRAPSWGYFKKHPLHMLLRIGLGLVLFGIGIFAHAWWLSGFVLGFAVGFYNRDLGRRQQVQSSVWPFYVKVIDWSKVECIANSEPSA